MLSFSVFAFLLSLLAVAWPHSGRFVAWFYLLSFPVFVVVQIEVLADVWGPLMVTSVLCWRLRVSERTSRLVLTCVAGTVFGVSALCFSRLQPYHEFWENLLFHWSVPYPGLLLTVPLMAVSFCLMYRKTAEQFLYCILSNFLVVFFFMPYGPVLFYWLLLTMFRFVCRRVSLERSFYQISGIWGGLLLLAVFSGSEVLLTATFLAVSFPLLYFWHLLTLAWADHSSLLSTRVYAIYCIACFLLLAGWNFRVATRLKNDPETIELQQRYPIENLQPRLAYESFDPEAPVPMTRLSEIEEQIDNDIWSELTSSDKRHERERSLSTLFDVQDNDTLGLMQEYGLGVADVFWYLPPRARYIDLPKRAPVLFSVRDASFTRRELEMFPRDAFVDPFAFWKVDADRFHATTVVDFLHVKGFGYGESLQKTIGFQSHGFTDPKLSFLYANDETKTVVKLNLITLLRVEEPRVYQSRLLPLMPELIDAPTRAVDEWEAAALTKLEAGENLVITEQEGRLRMLGAMRNGIHCQRCHQVKPRQLLGAFSYQVR